MLNIYVGAMYSGKTTELMNNYCRYKKYNQLIIDYDTNDYDMNNDSINNNTKKLKTDNGLTINYYLDKLYNHNKNVVDCIKTTNINLLRSSELVNNIKVIHINEAQFFQDLKMVVVYLVEILKINVYLYGLDGDFKREKFGEVLDLVPYCNTITKLKGVCNNCDNEALFSHRIIKSDKQFLVNTEDENSYIPLCRSCYLNTI
jgi:thymidine kinase